MSELPSDMRIESTQPPTSEFVAKLETQWSQGHFLCVGLDSDFSRIPQSIRDLYSSTSQIMLGFNIQIIDATADLACAFKPNAAFYEAEGQEGLEALRKTIEYIKEHYPNVPVIYDAKRADIGNTNDGYVKAAFDDLRADAVTVNPFFGREAIQPFLDRGDKGIIVLVRTSNPGAGEFQDIEDSDGVPLYLNVAKRIATNWNANGNVALVVGATAPAELAKVREAVGDMPFLIPGVGKQGGEVDATVKAGMDSRTWGMIINSSRDILFASSDIDFAQAARNKAREIGDAINLARAK